MDSRSLDDSSNDGGMGVPKLSGKPGLMVDEIKNAEDLQASGLLGLGLRAPCAIPNASDSIFPAKSQVS